METYIATFMYTAPNGIDVRYDDTSVEFKGENIGEVHNLVQMYCVANRKMLCTLTKRHWYIWTDSQSEIELPTELDHRRFDSLAEADTAASNAAHVYDGDQRRCIVHVEDGFYEETVTTYENFGNRCDA